MNPAVVEAIRAGKPVLLPTDTVYGLCSSPYRAEVVERVYRLKGRDPAQPSAILAADLEFLFECVPELRGRAGTILRALLPGPYTVVVPNPARRYRWLTGSRPDTIGVRVPELPEEASRVLERVGAVVATSANLAGGPDPRRLEDVPAELRAKVAAEVDAGALPGTPSTVLDVTGADPVVLREGAVPAEDALARVRSALG
ncbi:MAG TPA: L-threonylcarbamoyladenylate synthase [Gaiellaceae bacterium]|nr:L-threonylcarbamoyladenylate synthase [Gaiellaceae bacterium]